MNGTGASESLVDDFDLFWGIGPSRTETSQRRDSATSLAPSHPLNSNIMGGLWTQGTLEAYGHRHHRHGHVDVMNESNVVSPPGMAAPGGSRRPVHWPSPSPTRATTRSRDSSPLGIPMHHHSRTTGSGSINGGVNANADNLSAVESKMEELAALITTSVVGKLDQSVRGALQARGGINGISYSTPSPLVPTPEASTPTACADSGIGPLCSRVAALEEQVAELKVALERKSSISTSDGACRCPEGVSGDNDGPPNSYKGHQQSGSRGGRGACGCGNSGGNYSSLEQSFSTLSQRTGTLEGRHKQVQAKIALLDSAFGSKASDWAQTVRDILVEREAAAVASGTGSVILKGGGSRGAGRGGKKSNSANNASNTNNANISSGVTHTSQNDENSSGHTGNGTSKRSPGTTPQLSRETGSAASSPETSPVQIRVESGSSGERGIKDDAAHAAVGNANRVKRTSERELDTTPSSAGLAAEANEASRIRERSGQDASSPSDTATFAQPAAKLSSTAGGATRDLKSASSLRHPSCVKTEERCVKLEGRVNQSEKELNLLKEQMVDTVGRAAGAVATATAAQTGTSKAVEAAAAVESSVIAMRKEADGSEGRMRAMAAANSATKSLTDKVAGDVKVLAEKTKEGEEALALVDHGLKTLREEMAPLSGSCAALKRMVESHLREKEQASEMLKEYVTTITREVATITRQYINGLIGPGRPGLAAFSTSAASSDVGWAESHHQKHHPSPRDSNQAGGQGTRAKLDSQTESPVDLMRKARG